jgi:hypothetical protein
MIVVELPLIMLVTSTINAVALELPARVAVAL